nr:MAG TPA: hypothetical protein [Caudoviricetes sp.]
MNTSYNLSCEDCFLSCCDYTITLSRLFVNTFKIKIYLFRVGGLSCLCCYCYSNSYYANCQRLNSKFTNCTGRKIRIIWKERRRTRSPTPPGVHFALIH